VNIFKRIVLSLLPVITVCVSLIGCGGRSSGGEKSEIKASDDKITIYVGESDIIRIKNYSDLNKLEYEVEDENIAEVEEIDDGEFEVTGKSVGKTNVVISARGYDDLTVKIVVKSGSSGEDYDNDAGVDIDDTIHGGQEDWSIGDDFGGGSGNGGGSTATGPEPYINDEGYYVFGVYEQDNNYNNGPEPIEWEIITENENGILLASRYVLDAKPYHFERTDITWEDCSLRTWLNNDFMNTAFNDYEQSLINEVYLENKDNVLCETDGGNDTIDRVFLLSSEDVFSYFRINAVKENKEWCGFSQQAIVAPTEYAISLGLRVGGITQEDYNLYNEDDDWGYYLQVGWHYDTDCIGKAGCWWYLRNSGEYQDCAGCVDDTGYISGNYGNAVGPDHSHGPDWIGDEWGVRPALYLNID